MRLNYREAQNAFNKQLQRVRAAGGVLDVSALCVGGRAPARMMSPDGSKGDDMFEGLGMLAARSGNFATILWIIAAMCVISGIVSIFRGAVLGGIVLIIIGLLVGPGGVSIFK